ncbi:DNA repair protein RecN [Fumia xinanensis]|uniref:DNA repair protein RecN n=1 Tax=Fumia xinanensis TaxID=2763659 RepID=A0A926E0R2_9FIRM|nr:DNA repair protein RecN [Fumia xinanensis]MBC8559474.1 DNA repair protein RecN [Fumia xinanensis]
MSISMLLSLYIENLAVIEKACIDFDGGFTVFTGETGAGKSIVIDAINACLGQRASREIVRTGADKSSVLAIFAGVPQTILSLLRENGYEPEGGELSIAREIYADGRSTAKICGRPATVSFLKEVGTGLVNIHGQHDNQILLNPDRHLSIIDDYGELEGQIAAYRAEYQLLRDDIRALRTLTMDEEDKRRRIDTLTYQIDEIAAARLKPGLEEALEERSRFFRSGEKIAGALSVACGALLGDEEDSQGACDLIQAAKAALSELSEFPEFQKAAELLETLALDLNETASALKEQLNGMEYDPREADLVERHLSEIHRLKGKYGSTIEEVIAYGDKAKDELHRIESAEEELKRVNARALQQKQKVAALAAALTEKRRKTAEQFVQKVQEEAKFLEMPNLRLEARFTPCKIGANGGHLMELLISANAGEPPKPIAKIASGGELSRVMLAIKSALADKDQIGTLIFDEVDTGVSGRAAQKIGLKLKEVARSRQVLCVTHSAQVAALGDSHLLIEKRMEEGRTFTGVTPLSDEDRIREIARIMSTDRVTDLMLQNAASMLQEGKNPVY